jgi:hypothetical protein
MKTFNSLAMLGALAALSLPAFGQLSLATSRAAFPTTDTVDWSLLGPAFTTINSPFTIGTSQGSTVLVSHDPHMDFERRNERTGGWNGNFAFGDALLWNRGDNGSITFDPLNLISGAGFNVQTDSRGPFVLRLDAFDTGGNLLGSVSETGISTAALGTAIFIGFTSPLADVDSFVATLVSATSGPSNFAINSLALSGPAEAAPFVAVPEPSTYGMISVLLIFALVARERLRRHGET